ncbi:MAG: redoxin domain-containing protein, partial [Planctomycetota bacterium]
PSIVVAMTLPLAGCGKPVTNTPATDGEAPLTADAPEGADASEGAMLTIGSKAPTLDVEHWFGDPSRPSIESFESGKVYVVEFWATWCGPCIASIPHLAELQEQYADDGVTLVSISDEDTETVEAFLERTVRGAEGDDAPTYADLTSIYRLTTDPDQSSYDDYMSAAGQTGIPTAFLVGKEGVVEWIGHPMGLDGPLDAVVDGTWDRAAFGEEFRREQEEDFRRMKEQKRLQAEFQRFKDAKEAGDEEAIEAILAEWAASDDKALNQIASNVKRQIAVSQFMRDSIADPSKAADAFPEVIADFEGNAYKLNQFTWNLAQMAMAGQLTDRTLMQMAADATEAALDPDEPEGSLLDTIAHLYAQLGDLDKAIAYQERAVAAGQIEEDSDLQAEIEAYLAELRAMKAAAEAPAGEAPDAETPDAETAAEETPAGAAPAEQTSAEAPAEEETPTAGAGEPAEAAEPEEPSEPTADPPAEAAVDPPVEAPAES